MATSKEIAPPISLIAGAAIVAHRLVKPDTTAGTGIYTAAITDGPVGVSLATVASGEPVPLASASGSLVKLTAAAAITAGDIVMPDSGGSGKIATRSGATAVPVGRAIEAATADGDIIEVVFQPGQIGTA